MSNSKNKTRVTVAMPVYNASKFIKEAIESVLSQDYNKFELLIIDDGSQDNTLDIIKKYKNHPKVRIYKNKKNRGTSATRNKLVRLARGGYISPCDADDIMLPGNLKRLSRFLDTHPAIGVVYGDFLVIERDHKGKITRPAFIYGKGYNKIWDLAEDFVSHAGSMIRKSLILKVGGYDENVYSVGDRDLWFKLGEITKFKYLRDEIYYIYRRHPKNITYTDKKWYSDTRRIIKEAIKRRYNFEF